jgi:hypothetical protein
MVGIVTPPLGQRCLAAGETPELRDQVVQEFHSLFRTQKADGSLEFRGSHRFLEAYPVIATLTLDIHRSQQDPAFISHSAASAARYYGYLFTNRDRNANLLIERRLEYGGGVLLTGIEDPGFNSLLALDMLSLSRLYLEMRKPLQALYWYEGARTLQERIVNRCFDIDANYFFPYDTNNETAVRDYHAMSVAPLLFDGNLGDNHAGSLINHYVLRSPDVGPDPPSRLLQRFEPADGEVDNPLFHPHQLLKALVVAKTLHARGFERDANRVAENARERARWPEGTEEPHGRRPIASSKYLGYLLDDNRYQRLYDPFSALDIFKSIVRFKRRIADNEIVRVETSVETIKAFHMALVGRENRSTDDKGVPHPPDAKSVETSIRNLFWVVSKTREQVAANAYFDPEDSYRSSGLQLGPAMMHLLDDVVFALRRVESDLYRMISQNAGFNVTATLLNERAVIDQRVKVKWVITARRQMHLDIRSAYVISGQEVDSLVSTDDAVVVSPGEPQTLYSKFNARGKVANVLRPCDFTLVLMDGSGQRIRHNAFRTVYLEHPVRVVARFPEGQTLRGLSLPIEVQFFKRSNALMTLNGGWFSPSGLQLKEGNRFEFLMPAEQDTAFARFNVLVPDPCRPGSFPFKFKFYGNGKDLGLIASSFFKPYQWLFVGPFDAAAHALDAPYPPENAVDLRKGYAGIGRRIIWQALPETANAKYGEVSLRGMLSPSGVGYLYTVIEASREMLHCPVYLASNAPAALFVNGVRVLDCLPGPDRIAVQKPVRVRRGMNNILIKVVGDQSTRVFFKLGDETNLASDEFNNNLWQLIGDFGEFQERSRRLLAGETEDVQKLITLRFEDATAHSVSVIGTFNGWSPEHSRMHRRPGGAWEITLSLQPGKYAYRFLVNNRKQVLDPDCPFEEPDGYGGKNSILYVMK